MQDRVGPTAALALPTLLALLACAPDVPYAGRPLIGWPAADRAPITTADARLALPLDTLRITAAGDVDGDGSTDLAVEIVGRGRGRRIDLVSGRDGRRIRRAWRGVAPACSLSWDAGHDVEGDGVPDVVVAERPGESVALLGDVDGDGRADRVIAMGAGGVAMVSGRDGAALWHREESAAHVTSVGDLDGDGAGDLLVRRERRDPERVRILSGATGELLGRLAHRFGPVGPAGDLDAAGVPDLFVDAQDRHCHDRPGGTHVVSGESLTRIAAFPYPDPLGDFGVTSAVGDLDADGHADLALGEPNYRLPLPEGAPVPESLRAALDLPTDPWSMTYESGCTVAFSGRTHEAFAAVYGMPASMDGVGFGAVPLAGGELAVAGGRTVWFLSP